MTTRQLQLYRELLWLVLAGLVAAVAVVPLINKFYFEHYRYVFLVLMLVVIYFRFIIFYRQIPYLKSTAMKVALIVLNPMVFFVVYFQMQFYFNMFDSYEPSKFVLAGRWEDVDLYAKFTYFKQLLIFTSVSALILCVIFELRLLRALFIRPVKVREKVLYKKDDTIQ